MKLSTLDPVCSKPVHVAPDLVRQRIAFHFDDPCASKLPLKSHAGCGCKVSGCDVQDGLRAAHYFSDGEKFTPEDSALRTIQGASVLMTTDGGLPVCRFPYLAGSIAVIHAFSDIYARGGRPRYVLSTVMIDDETSTLALRDLLAGIRETALEEGAEIVNGQTLRGQDIVLSVSVVGEPDKRVVLGKGGGRPGESLMISKPIGTGLLLRAIALEVADPKEERAAIEIMSTSNRLAIEHALEAGVTSCTDVTGFGLAGHLAELTAGMGATVQMDKIPLIPGASRLLDELEGSIWMEQNIEYAASSHDLRFGSARCRMTAGDPQTSGPLLVTVPATGKTRLEQAGFVEIGVVEAQSTLYFL